MNRIRFAIGAANRRWTLPILFATILRVPAAEAAIAYVGPGCTYTDLQAAIDAAGTSPEADEIRILREPPQMDQALSINDAGMLDIVGGYLGCDGEAREGESTLDGAGGPQAPVLVVNAEGTIRLSFLRIENGDNLAGAGGGIRYTSTGGTLELSSMFVTGNRAGTSGGGIDASGPATFDAHAGGVGPTLRVGAFVFIGANHAMDGGGMRVTHARLDMSGANIGGFIGNEAGRDGGGLHLLAARADIGSGYPDGPFRENVAGGEGGGLHAGPGSDVRLFNTTAGRAVTFLGNVAAMGGAISVHGGDSARARAAVFDGVMASNSAMSGPGVYVHSGGGANIAAFCMRDRLHAADGGECAGSAWPDGALECPPGQFCNRLTDNRPPLPSGAHRGIVRGAAAYAEGVNAVLDLRAAHIDNNQGSSVLERDAPVDVAGSGIVLTDCLITANTAFDGALLETRGAAQTRIAGCTIADNAIAAETVIRGDDIPFLVESIVWQPDAVVYAHTSDPSVQAFASMVIANELTTLSFEAGTALVAEPAFIDATEGDYRLQPGISPAIDFSSLTGESDHDIDGRERGADDPAVADRFGRRDLGAFEACPPDRLFRDGFESSDAMREATPKG